MDEVLPTMADVIIVTTFTLFWLMGAVAIVTDGIKAHRNRLRRRKYNVLIKAFHDTPIDLQDSRE